MTRPANTLRRLLAATALGVSLLAACGSSSHGEASETPQGDSRFCAKASAVKAPRRGFHVRLLSSGTTFSPGEAAFFRVANEGTTYVNFGPVPTAEQSHDGHWTRLVIRKAGLPIAYPLTSVTLGSGGIAECIEVPLSPKWPDGSYRVRVEVAQGRPGSGGPHLFAIARFHLQGAAPG